MGPGKWVSIFQLGLELPSLQGVTKVSFRLDGYGKPHDRTVNMNLYNFNKKIEVHCLAFQGTGTLNLV